MALNFIFSVHKIVYTVQTVVDCDILVDDVTGWVGGVRDFLMKDESFIPMFAQLNGWLQRHVHALLGLF